MIFLLVVSYLTYDFSIGTSNEISYQLEAHNCTEIKSEKLDRYSVAECADLDSSRQYLDYGAQVYKKTVQCTEAGAQFTSSSDLILVILQFIYYSLPMVMSYMLNEVFAVIVCDGMLLMYYRKKLFHLSLLREVTCYRFGWFLSNEEQENIKSSDSETQSKKAACCQLPWATAGVKVPDTFVLLLNATIWEIIIFLMLYWQFMKPLNCAVNDNTSFGVSFWATICLCLAAIIYVFRKQSVLFDVDISEDMFQARNLFIELKHGKIRGNWYDCFVIFFWVPLMLLKTLLTCLGCPKWMVSWVDLFYQDDDGKIRRDPEDYYILD